MLEAKKESGNVKPENAEGRSVEGSGTNVGIESPGRSIVLELGVPVPAVGVVTGETVPAAAGSLAGYATNRDRLIGEQQPVDRHNKALANRDVTTDDADCIKFHFRQHDEVSRGALEPQLLCGSRRVPARAV